MRKSLVLFGIVAALVPVPAFAQPAGGGGPSDPTSAVKSGDMGMPGQNTNAVDQYLQRKSLQDISTGQRVQKSDSKLGASRPARKDELTAGAVVNDKTGAPIARIESVDADGVVVSMGAAKVKVPPEAFGHNKAGLLFDMTKAQFEQVIAQAK